VSKARKKGAAAKNYSGASARGLPRRPEFRRRLCDLLLLMGATAPFGSFARLRSVELIVRCVCSLCVPVSAPERDSARVTMAASAAIVSSAAACI